MLGPFDDEDDDFCQPIAGSNLANVFSANMNPETDNESLKYVPPKQQPKAGETSQQPVPKPPENPAEVAKPQTAPATTCIIAKIVNAFQSLNDKNVPKGKLGLALLKLSAVPDLFKMVVYTGAKKTITTATTNNKNVCITLQANNYIHMYDDSQQNWSMMFSNEKDYADFVAELKKCKVRLVDDTIKHSKDASNEDTQNMEKATRKPEDTTEETEDKTKAELLKRMAKMGQAIIAPKPSSTSEVTSDSSDSNCDKATSLASHKKSSKPSPAARKQVTVKPKETQTSPTPQPSAFSRTKSLGNAYYQPGVVPSSISSYCLNTNQNVVNVGGVNYLYLNGQLIPVPLPEQTFPTLSQQNLVNPYTGIDPLSILFAETRTHNSEIRQNINRMTDRLDKMLDKMENVDTSPLINNIDYESVKSKVNSEIRTEYESKLKDCYKKINKLQPKLANVTELTNVLKKQNDDMEKLQVENAELKAKIQTNEKTMALHNADRVSKEVEFNRLKSQIEENESKLTQLEDFCEKITTLKSENEELFETIQLLEQQLNDVEKQGVDSSVVEAKNEEIEELKVKINEVQCSKDNLLSELETVKAQSKEHTDSKVKNIMNELYQTLIEKFEGDASFRSEEICNIIAATVKDTTIKMLEQN